MNDRLLFSRIPGLPFSLAYSCFVLLATPLASRAVDTILNDDFSSGSIGNNTLAITTADSWRGNNTSKSIASGQLRIVSADPYNGVEEGIVGRVIAIGAQTGSTISVSFDYSVVASSTMYVNLRGVSSNTTVWSLNTGAQNGNVWDSNTGGITYRLVDGANINGNTALQGPTGAIASLTGSGSYSTDIDISGYTLSDVSSYSYLMFGFAFNFNSAGTSWVDNVLLQSYTPAASTIWDGGGGDTNINTAANWDGDITPTLTGGTENLQFGTGGSTVTVNTATDVNMITINRAANLTIAAGGNLTVGAGGIVVSSTGGRSHTISGGVTLSADQTINVGTGESLTFSGAIGGSYALTKDGAGTLTLSGANTYTGATLINAGTLQITGAGQLGGGSHSGNIAITGGAFTYNSTADQTLSGQISGGGTLFKYASSTLTLSGSNTRSGSLVMGVHVGNLTAGAVKLEHNNALGTGGVDWDNDGTIELAANGLTISNSNNIFARNSATDGKRRYRLDLAGSNTGTFSGNFDVRMSGLVFDVGTDDTLTASGSFSNVAGGGGFEKTGAGTLVLTGSTNTLSGNIVISAGTLQIGNGGTTGTLNSHAVTNNGALVFNRSNAITVANAISGSGNVIKNAASTLTLTGSNTYSGGTTLNTGTLVIGNAAAAGSGTITQTDGTSLLTFDTTGTIANNMSIYNVASNQSVTLTGSITAQNTTYDVASGTTLSINGSIGGSGGVTKDGDGTLELNAANTFTGDTEINFGTLEANASGSLASTGNITVNGGSLLVGANNAINESAAMDLAGGTLEFNGNINETVGALTLSANSVIDMGGGNIALEFSNLVTQLTSTTQLKIYNYTLYSDHISFGSNTNLSDSLPYISFYSGFGTGFIGNSFIEGINPYEIRPVPEPETWATAAILLIGGGLYLVRRKKQTAQSNA